MASNLQHSDDLKPCPFCGNRAMLVHEDGEYWVRCLRVGVCFGHALYKPLRDHAGFTYKNDAVELWNRRSGAEVLNDR